MSNDSFAYIKWFASILLGQTFCVQVVATKTIAFSKKVGALAKFVVSKLVYDKCSIMSQKSDTLKEPLLSLTIKFEAGSIIPGNDNNVLRTQIKVSQSIKRRSSSIPDLKSCTARGDGYQEYNFE